MTKSFAFASGMLIQFAVMLAACTGVSSQAIARLESQSSLWNGDASVPTTWSGKAGAPQDANGLYITWAYSPSEYRVFTGADSSSMEEVSGWRTPTHIQFGSSETVSFNASRQVREVRIEMRLPRTASGYFGIEDVAFLIDAGSTAFMLVAGSAAGDECLAVDNGNLVGKKCVDAIAEGSGGEIFRLSSEAEVVSAKTGTCLSRSTSRGITKPLILQDCDEAAAMGDGRSKFSVTTGAQLKLASESDLCLSASGNRSTVGPCSSSGGQAVDFQPFVVQGYHASAAAAAQAKDAAALLGAATSRQKRLLQELRLTIARCKGVAQANVSNIQEDAADASFHAHFATSRGRLDTLLDIDLADVAALIQESRAAMSSTGNA